MPALLFVNFHLVNGELHEGTMPPRNVDQMPLSTLDDELPETIDEQPQSPAPPPIVKRPPMQIVWRNVVWFFFLHCFAIYGLYLLPYAKPVTWLWGKTSCDEMNIRHSYRIQNAH